MQITRFQLANLSITDKMIADYLQKSSQLSPFIHEFPSDSSFLNTIQNRKFSDENRQILADELSLQYQTLGFRQSVADSIELLRRDNTFTVTTGHQLCLFTGPMYFVFKIISTIKLAEELRVKFPQYNFIPVYWMASEDHDFEEINHTWLNGKKMEWTNNLGGAVGRLSLEGIEPLIEALELLLPDSPHKNKWVALLRDVHETANLSTAIQNLVHQLFGEKGLVVMNPDSRSLKQMFVPAMRAELLANDGDKRIAQSTSQLQDLGYKTLVHPRSINLFYLSENARARIEKNGSGWNVIGQEKQWTEVTLLEELTQNPENFSPNVVMRPLYQEVILPNIAYIGGPGEISYWMQFKSNFDHFQIAYPLLILRDSALILTPKQQSRFSKTGLALSAIFQNRNEQLAAILPVSDISAEEEKISVSALFDGLKQKASNIDPTLEAFVNAEKQRQLQSIESIEKKMTKALKQREDVKIQQLDKIMEELFPNGKLNERRDSFLPLLNEFGPGLMDVLYSAFDPLQGELKVVMMD